MNTPEQSEQPANTAQQNSAIKHLPLKLFGSVVLMFGFGFALVPLYDVFCDITGINGKGFIQADITEPEQDEQAKVIASQPLATAQAEEPTAAVRMIKVQFLASSKAGFQGQFNPEKETLKVKIGESNETYYLARNAAPQAVNLQAIPSISPAEAAQYITKFECFCFTQQALLAGQSREMGLTFSVSDDLPDHINTVTFAYSLYAIDSAIETPNENAASQQLGNSVTVPDGGQAHEPNS
jgi:cytochrome c oxidase assembly protein subunit 11